MFLNRRFFSLLMIPALFLSVQCAPKRPAEETDSEASTLNGNYSAHWLRIFKSNIRHYVFFVGAEKGKGDNQCWYEAKSNMFDGRRDPELMRQASKSFSDGYINVAQAEVLVKEKLKALSPSVESEKQEIAYLNRGIKIMNDERSSAGGRLLAVHGNSKNFEKAYTEQQVKEYVNSLKAVFDVASKAVNRSDLCPSLKVDAKPEIMLR
jgi:hypothetical protein